MSLLLDALKRAEQEKLTRQGDRPAGREAGGRAPSESGAPMPALTLQPLAGAAPSTPAHSDAQAAQTVFQAKTPAKAPGRRGVLWAAAAAIVVVVLSAGAYVWYSLRTLAPRMAPVALSRVAPVAPIVPRAPGTPAMPSGLAPPAPPAVPPPSAAFEPGAHERAPLPPSASAATSPPAASGEAAAAAPKLAATPLEELLRRPAPTKKEPVELARTEEQKPRVPANVQEGYAALVAGDLATARSRYAAAIAADDTDVDAQLGLATVDARSGNRVGAAAHYRRALELDPRNATALAGLAALAADARPEAVERDLRGEIEEHPGSAALRLALGNLYASQARWSEAQDAYFGAYRLQPENADIAYNLAVSLDHIGQRRPAADFYRRALEARRESAAQFDAAAAARRLAELTR